MSKKKSLTRGQIILLLGVVILVMQLGGLNPIGKFSVWIASLSPPTGGGGGGGGTTPTTPTTPSAKEAAQLQLGLQDAVTQGSITTGTTGFDLAFIRSNIVDFMTGVEHVTINSASEQSVSTYLNEGDMVLLHLYSQADPTGGEDYYDGWYVAKMVVGDPVYKLKPGMLTVSSSSPTYKYTLNTAGAETTGYTVKYTAGTTKYWDIGATFVTPRTDDASLDQYLMYKGTTLASMTDGTTEVDTQAEQSNNVQMLSNDDDMTLKLSIDTTNLAYAVPMYTISSVGEFQERGTFVIISTNSTAIGSQALINEGWKALSDNTLTAEKAFYKRVPQVIPLKGDTVSLDINIPIDSSSLTRSDASSLNVWMNDFQLEAAVAIGAPSTSIPSSYGLIVGGNYGIVAIINDETYSTSSGAGTGMTLFGDWQAPA